MVARSKKWNASVGITGALAFTELNFVQFIEGPATAILDMMAKLRADARHTDMNVIEDLTAESRQFHGWSLAYSGPEKFIDRDLGPLLQIQSDTTRHEAAANLRRLLLAMTTMS